jgi:hypothetical protein
VGLDPQTIYDLAAASLDAIVDNWPVELEPLPDRRYVTFGEVAWDCEQLVVSVERTFGVDTGDVLSENVLGIDASAPFQLRGATVACSLIRCVPVVDDQGNPPTPVALADSATVVLADGIAMFNCLADAHRAGDLATCNGVAFEAGEAQTPDGGFGGWLTRVRLLMV